MRQSTKSASAKSSSSTDRRPRLDALTVLAGGLMVLAPAAVNAKNAYAMDMQRIAWQSYRHRIDMKSLPRPEWPRPF